MPKSLTYNPFEDDLTMRNYLALYSCIVNPKLSYDRALAIFEVNNKNNSEIKSKNLLRKSRMGYKVKITDIHTKEILICEDSIEIQELIGINQRAVSIYIKHGYLYNKRYRLEKIE